VASSAGTTGCGARGRTLELREGETGIAFGSYARAMRAAPVVGGEVGGVMAATLGPWGGVVGRGAATSSLMGVAMECRLRAM